MHVVPFVGLLVGKRLHTEDNENMDSPDAVHSLSHRSSEVVQHLLSLPHLHMRMHERGSGTFS